MSEVALALIHHPVRDRQGAPSTTTITTLDLHDLSRAAVTYGLAQMFAVHPIEAQRQLALRIRQHWVEGSGGRRIPDRARALEALRVVASLEDACATLAPGQGRAGVELWTTAAVARGAEVTPFAAARQRLAAARRPVLLCFGTGWGLTDDLCAAADLRLEPITGSSRSDYNHLSVRAAAAIVLDRLLG
ncbi:MAG: RNA methyltransferase [Deltaproteobacteria bacterium]|jgi:hypothetical protein|nr:RNA methyltransferase [Deltaproteobacteria bacterium]MBW2534589.1 RNA methyltransferase [Deltaproteobacteria bacterium]